jgi:hypothetical protein
MSYDFIMMRPRAEITAGVMDIESMDDLGEDTLLRQEPSALVEALSSLFPDLAWRRETDGGWFGTLEGDDSRYELRIGAEPDYAWSVCTSHGARSRGLVPVICDQLGLLAFDGQANVLIWPAGHSRRS